MSCLAQVQREQDAGPIMGLEPVHGDFAFYDWERDAVRNMMRPPNNDPVFFYLSKFVYPAEDGHLDVVAWLDTRRTNNKPIGYLTAELFDEQERLVSSERVDDIPGRQLFFSYAIPEQMTGAAGTLRLTWWVQQEKLGQAEHSFEVAAPAAVLNEGAIRISVPNDEGVTLASAPMTVGVPFPRGALMSTDHLRLVDEQGNEIALQAEPTAMWSRFGSIKWVLCDFEVDLDGGSRELVLAYGPQVSRKAYPSMKVEKEATGFPTIQTAVLRSDQQAVAVISPTQNTAVNVLSPSAWFGGFVEHEDGQRYVMLPDTSTVEIEHTGSVKTVIRVTGDYVNTQTGETFCRYDTRYHFFRTSPLVRVVHTWLFTGDGNHDRIRDMGWQFRYAQPPSDAQVLLVEDDPSTWQHAAYLVQHRHDAFDLVRAEGVTSTGDRAPGVMRAMMDRVSVTLGIKDFWQNYPSELSLDEQAMTFHNWPRHGRANNEPVTPENAFLLSFAHSGELLDFRLPDAFLTGEIPRLSSQERGGERHWLDRESANAQGIARTEEMWLHFAHEDDTEVNEANLMHALNQEALRAVVDPAWVAASGAFYEIHPRDEANYAVDEAIYEQVALAPARWTERIGVYGMWIYGDTLFEPHLAERSAGLYRTFRKSHQGWPYAWIPYIRSGDSRFFKLAQNATWQMIDANFCHYVSPDVAASVSEARGGYYRRQGWWFRSMLPWAGWRGPVSRSYLADCDFLWHAYYITGDQRPADIARLWGELAKEEVDLGGAYSRTGAIGKEDELRRKSFALLKSFTEMYQATFDPWFIVAMHEIADMHLTENRDVQWDSESEPRVGHFWETGDREYHRFTGRKDYEPYYLNAARVWATHHMGPWSRFNPPMIEQTAYAARLSDDPLFARRAAYFLDYAKTSIWTSDEYSYLKGTIANDIQLSRSSVFIGYYLKQFPEALALFSEMNEYPEPLAEAFYQLGIHKRSERVDADRYRYIYPTIYIRKSAGQALPLLIELNRSQGQLIYRITGPNNTVVAQERGDASEPHRVELSASMPPGVYVVEVEAVLSLEPDSVVFSLSRFPGLKVPISPPGTPEVMQCASDGRMGYGQQKSQYWFKAPDDQQQIFIRFFVDPPFKQARRLSVWDANGSLVWDRQLSTYGKTQSQTIEAELTIPSDQRGRLWRITLPGPSAGFQLPDDVMHVVSVDRERWFNPFE